MQIDFSPLLKPCVTSYTGCVSRNVDVEGEWITNIVTSYTGCVSRNLDEIKKEAKKTSHILHGMCE